MLQMWKLHNSYGSLDYLTHLLPKLTLSAVVCMYKRKTAILSLEPVCCKKQQKKFLTSYYSRVQKSWNEVFFKILKKPSILQKKMTFKALIFGNFWGPEAVGSSWYQKKLAHNLLIYIGLHCVRRSLWTVTTLATLM